MEGINDKQTLFNSSKLSCMKPFNHLLVLPILSILVFSQGCFTLNQVGTPIDEAIEITNSLNARSVKHFSRTKTVNHFIFGLVSPDDVGIEKIVSDEVKLNAGTRAINVKLKYQQTFLNAFVSVITIGIYTPFTLTIEGDVAK